MEWRNSKAGDKPEEEKMSEEKFELYVGETTKLENTKLNIQGNAKIDGCVSGEIETRLLEIGPKGVVEGKVQANRSGGYARLGFRVCSSEKHRNQKRR